jgi:mannitol-specific phosphotransferase system IIBC component
VSTRGDRPGGHAAVTALRVLCRLLRLIAAAAAGTGVAITVLRAMAGDPEELPGISVLVVLAVVAVVTFLVATLVMMVAERLTERADRAAEQQYSLTPQEREAERLRETPFLARQQDRQQHPPLDL